MTNRKRTKGQTMPDIDNDQQKQDKRTDNARH